MDHYICLTCGVQFERSEQEPEFCLICNEERQYVSAKGQKWTSLDQMIEEGTWINAIHKEEEGLYSIHTTPEFAIAQTAYFVRTGGFNLLWDCITYLDPATISEINDLGGIDAIALSHPHYYSTQVEWAEAFGAPIYIHEDDQRWVTRMSDRIIFWKGDVLYIHEGVTIRRVGGHFKGAAIAEWRSGDAGRGILLTGDVIRVVADRKWVTFMYSYPNFIPLPAKTVQSIAERISEVQFNRMYDAFHRMIPEQADLSVQKSAKRYIDALNGVLFDT